MNKLRQWINDNGITQQEAADILGLSRQTISYYYHAVLVTDKVSSLIDSAVIPDDVKSKSSMRKLYAEFTTIEGALKRLRKTLNELKNTKNIYVED